MTSVAGQRFHWLLCGLNFDPFKAELSRKQPFLCLQTIILTQKPIYVYVLFSYLIYTYYEVSRGRWFKHMAEQSSSPKGNLSSGFSLDISVSLRLVSSFADVIPLVIS